MTKPQKELSTKITINKKNYLVITEDLGIDKHFITTTIYIGGEIVSIKKTDYKNLLNGIDLETEIRDLMKRQHEFSIFNLKEFKKGKTEEKK